VSKYSNWREEPLSSQQSECFASLFAVRVAFGNPAFFQEFWHENCGDRGKDKSGKRHTSRKGGPQSFRPASGG